MVSLPNNFSPMLKGNLRNGISNGPVIIIAVIVIIISLNGGGITI